jgi:AraC-like DNA-binding protein
MRNYASRFNPVVRYANRLACRPGETFGPRMIEDYQWLYVERGEGEVMINGRCYSVGAGCLLSYGPGVPHRISASDTDPFVLYGLHFIPEGELENIVRPDELRIRQIQSSTELMNDESRYIAPFPELIPTYTFTGLAVLPYFEKLVKEYDQNDDLSPLNLRAVLSQLFVGIRRKGMNEAVTLPHSIRVNEIKKLLEERAEQAYQMDWLEECTGYSHDYASKIFKESTTISPHAYHQQMKLRIAQHYLESTAMTITEIADKLQFGSIHYFSKWFRMMTGAPPSAFRSRPRMI